MIEDRCHQGAARTSQNRHNLSPRPGTVCVWRAGASRISGVPLCEQFGLFWLLLEGVRRLVVLIREPDLLVYALRSGMMVRGERATLQAGKGR